MVNRITTDPKEMEIYIAESILNGTAVEIELKTGDERHIIFPLSIEGGSIACRTLKSDDYTSHNNQTIRFEDINRSCVLKQVP